MPYMLNGDLLEIDSEPRLDGGTLWVPLRKLATALGGRADWEPSNRVAVMYLGNQIATFRADEANVSIDGQKHALQAPVRLEEGETWVPVRAFEALGYTLEADAHNKIVHLKG